MTHLPAQFGGIVPPLSTPFTPSFEIDIASLQRLIEFQLSAGVHGIFVLGSTGEAAFLTDQQRAKVIKIASQAIGRRVPLFEGIVILIVIHSTVNKYNNLFKNQLSLSLVENQSILNLRGEYARNLCAVC